MMTNMQSRSELTWWLDSDFLLGEVIPVLISIIIQYTMLVNPIKLDYFS